MTDWPTVVVFGGIPAIMAVVHLVGLAYAPARRGTPRPGSHEREERPTMAESTSKSPAPSGKVTATDQRAESATARAVEAQDAAQAVAPDSARRGPTDAERAQEQRDWERTATDSSDMQRQRDEERDELEAAQERARTTGVGGEPELPPGKVDNHGPASRARQERGTRAS